MKTPSLFMAPMTTWSSNADLTVSEAELRYIERRAKNVDYAITGCTFTLRMHQSFTNQFYAGSDEFIPSLAALAAAIHKGGAKAILQVHSPGRMVSPDMQADPAIEVVSASAVRPEREGYKTPRKLTESEIEEIVYSYYEVTRRAIKAGFDGLEIHGANTYLPQQFVSPLTNLRDDKYGKDRLLFVKQLVESAEKARRDAGREDFLLGYRFSPEEREPGGLRLVHTFELLDYLCSTKVDYLHASLESYDRKSYFDDTLIASALNNCIHHRKPLIGVGRIRTKADVEKALQTGFDHVALGVTLLLNPEWKNTSKVQTEIFEHTVPDDIPAEMRKMLVNVFSKFVNSQSTD